MILQALCYVMKVCAVIAAHNEAQIIGPTVEHALKAVAPNPVFVIADRSDDGTAARAKAVGARVLERRDGPPGKGAAIAWFLGQSEATEADAWLIVDADSRLHPQALPPLVRSLESGADAVQAFVFLFDDARPFRFSSATMDVPGDDTGCAGVAVRGKHDPTESFEAPTRTRVEDAG
jgi:glycosyltransferase involved in cell wall biosynthesis